MSKSDDLDDKITVLFPDSSAGDGQEDTDSAGDDGDGDGALEPVGEQETDPEEESSADKRPSSQPESDETDDDNVVRLDFDHDEQTRRSPRPVDSEADEEDLAKLEAFESMIDDGMVMVTLDPGQDGVQVPPKFSSLPELRLNFSYMFHINDFEFDSQGVRASLSFDGSRFYTDIPWSAVSMVYSHETGDVVVFEPNQDP